VNGEQFTVFPGFWVDSIQFDPEMWIVAQMSSLTIGLEEEHVLQANIFPNPVKDIINIHLNAEAENVTAHIYDLSGKVIYAVSLANGKQFTVPVSALATGTYILEIHSDQGILREKFVK
jgi:hypothetical protein